MHGRASFFDLDEQGAFNLNGCAEALLGHPLRRYGVAGGRRRCGVHLMHPLNCELVRLEQAVGRVIWGPGGLGVWVAGMALGTSGVTG